MRIATYFCFLCDLIPAGYGQKLCTGCEDNIKASPTGDRQGLRFCCRWACEGEDHSFNCQYDYDVYKQHKAYAQQNEDAIKAEEVTVTDAELKKDAVNNPEHYVAHPSGVECITVTEHMSFCLGNVIKYVWRADLKGGIKDLRKARWYIDREIQRRSKGQ